MKTSLGSIYSCLFKSLYPGVGWGQKGGSNFTLEYIEKILKIFLKTARPEKLKLLWKYP